MGMKDNLPEDSRKNSQSIAMFIDVSTKPHYYALPLTPYFLRLTSYGLPLTPIHRRSDTIRGLTIERNIDYEIDAERNE